MSEMIMFLVKVSECDQSLSHWKNIRKPQIYLTIIQKIYFEVQTFL